MKSMTAQKHAYQPGLVSIVVTMVLMLVISLLVLSFSRIIRREQQQQTDRQLSSRAFYAAESGVNIAVKKLKDGSIPAGTNKTDCGETGAFVPGEFTIDAASNTQVTCLTINQTPNTLEYSAISDKSQLVPLVTSDGSGIAILTFSWQAADPSSVYGCASSGTLPRGDGGNPWTCGQPLLRLDLVPTTGVLDRASMLSGMMTMFLYPVTGGVATFAGGSAAGAQQGAIVPVHCGAAVTPRRCTVTINSGLGANNYTARIMSLYGTSQLTVSALNTSGTMVSFSGAQALIDSTAKAQDVLRRIQVRKPIGGDFAVPDFGIESAAGLCKLYSVIPPSTVNVDPAGSADPACAIN